AEVASSALVFGSTTSLPCVEGCLAGARSASLIAPTCQLFDRGRILRHAQPVQIEQHSGCRPPDVVSLVLNVPHAHLAVARAKPAALGAMVVRLKHVTQGPLERVIDFLRIEQQLE